MAYYGRGGVPYRGMGRGGMTNPPRGEGGMEYPGQDAMGYPQRGEGGIEYPGQGGMGYPPRGDGGMEYPGMGQGATGYPPRGQGGMEYPGMGQGATGYPPRGDGGMEYPGMGQGGVGYPQWGEGGTQSDTGSVPVPYILKLPKRFESGQTLIVRGIVLPNAETFSVNLLRGSPEIETSIATILHVKALFSENKLIFNTYENGRWGRAESCSNPFKPDSQFDLRICVHDDRCDIYADRKEVHSYRPPISIATADFLAVRGCIQLFGVHFSGRYYTLPHHEKFPYGHLRSGERVLIHGTPNGNRFQIDLLAANGDSLFHFNPRFQDKVVVRNARLGDVWGEEEREGQFLLKKNAAVDLVFLNEPYSMQVFVDGNRFCTFAHRTPNPGQDYNGLSISGEFELTGLEFSNRN